MREQTIGVEIEFTGMSREAAAATAAAAFGTTAQHTGGSYDAWQVTDGAGRVWKVMSDASVRAEQKINGTIRQACGNYKCELVTPILTYTDIEPLQELIRKLRKAGAFVNETCGLHCHIGAAGMTTAAVRNLVNNVASHEELLFEALQVHEGRKKYCKPTDERFLRELNESKPETLEELKKVWYGQENFPTFHYHSSRYTVCNLHSFFTKGTIEFRIFNGTLHAGEVKTAIQLCAALVANAKTAKRTPYRKVNLDNPKFAMRTWLTRPAGLNLNGAEFETLRHHLTKNLDGNAAWRFAV